MFNTILPLEFMRMSRIIISTKSISDYLRATNFFFQDMADLLRNKAEVRIELTSTRLFAIKVSPTALKRGLQARFYRTSSKYSDGDLVRDCITAIYPDTGGVDVANSIALRDDNEKGQPNPTRSTAGDESDLRGVYLILRPPLHCRRKAFLNGAEIKYTERKFRYDRDSDAFELEYAPGHCLSVPVPR